MLLPCPPPPVAFTYGQPPAFADYIPPSDNVCPPGSSPRSSSNGLPHAVADSSTGSLVSGSEVLSSSAAALLSRGEMVSSGDSGLSTRRTSRESKKFSIPQNVYRDVLEVYVSFHKNDEFWYGNYPNEYIEANNLTSVAGNGLFREVVVSLDGATVGSVWPCTVICTGGINPLFWRPITGIGSFDLPSYNIEMTPFLSKIQDGEVHEFSFTVTNALNVWYIDANLHLWLDKKSTRTTSKLLSYSSAPLVHCNDKVDLKTGCSSVKFIRSYKKFPINFNTNVFDQGNHTLSVVTNLTFAFNEKKREKAASGVSWSKLRNVQTAEEYMVAKNNLVVSASERTTEVYKYDSDNGCYFRNVSSSNYTILYDDVEDSCDGGRTQTPLRYGLKRHGTFPFRKDVSRVRDHEGKESCLRFASPWSQFIRSPEIGLGTICYVRLCPNTPIPAVECLTRHLSMTIHQSPNILLHIFGFLNQIQKLPI
ncbi:hypothetical protein CRG98_030012 [Punica granatum]|uniref:Peptide N-acetyl-beta-D-glucosaminyl asparaginase amidase A N-terminal domain-containing protein n=1 Tax=Punica granatum TaxID=22663 RepID=A0A2I0J071_PUNGR|nr:hypothetical protein CRG98_030012 [Punica granatum]